MKEISNQSVPLYIHTVKSPSAVTKSVDPPFSPEDVTSYVIAPADSITTTWPDLTFDPSKSVMVTAEVPV